MSRRARPIAWIAAAVAALTTIGVLAPVSPVYAISGPVSVNLDTISRDPVTDALTVAVTTTWTNPDPTCNPCGIKMVIEFASGSTSSIGQVATFYSPNPATPIVRSFTRTELWPQAVRVYAEIIGQIWNGSAWAALRVRKQ